MVTRSEVAQMVDHTLLKPEATALAVLALLEQAKELGVFAICVSPNMLPVIEDVDKGGVKIATVCGFPSGKHDSSIKAAEAQLAEAHGADEVDMVIDVGAAKAGQWAAVQADIATVRGAISDKVLLKVIIESAALTDEEIVKACEASEAAGAQYVKTSTGFHPSGGASTHAVALMRKTVGDRLGVKASGGVRDGQAALDMIAAGASRLGLSGSAEVLDGIDA